MDQFVKEEADFMASIITMNITLLHHYYPQSSNLQRVATQQFGRLQEVKDLEGAKKDPMSHVLR